MDNENNIIDVEAKEVTEEVGFKAKVKGFWKKHKVACIVTGGLLAGGIAAPIVYAVVKAKNSNGNGTDMSDLSTVADSLTGIDSEIVSQGLCGTEGVINTIDTPVTNITE